MRGTVLNGINLTISPGETVVIMGGSGSGKSTLLRHMIGTFEPNEGTVRILGQDLSELNEDGLNDVRKQFGILFQSGALFQSLTVAENVSLPLEEHTDLDANIIDFMVNVPICIVNTKVIYQVPLFIIFLCLSTTKDYHLLSSFRPLLYLSMHSVLLLPFQ